MPAFVDKFLCRGASFRVLASLARAVVCLQQLTCPPSVSRNEYHGACFTVHAALHDAAQAVLRRGDVDRALVATIVKFIGKGFGSLAATNAAIRVAEWSQAACGILPAQKDCFV